MKLPFVPFSFHLQIPFFIVFLVFFVSIRLYLILHRIFAFLFFFRSFRDDMYGRSTPHFWLNFQWYCFLNVFFLLHKKIKKREPDEGGHYMCVCVFFAIMKIQFDAALQEIKSKGKMWILALQLVFIPTIFIILSLSLFLPPTYSSEQRQQ